MPHNFELVRKLRQYKNHLDHKIIANTSIGFSIAYVVAVDNDIHTYVTLAVAAVIN